MCYHCVSSQIFFTFTFSFFLFFREEDVSYTYHQYEDSSSLIHSDIRVALNHHSTHHQGRRRRKQQRNLVHTFRVIQRQSFFRNSQVQESFINSSEFDEYACPSLWFYLYPCPMFCPEFSQSDISPNSECEFRFHRSFLCIWSTIKAVKSNNRPAIKRSRSDQLIFFSLNSPGTEL